jgi:Inactive homolog of metal-dependent proteases, putative molecular chaperone
MSNIDAIAVSKGPGSYTGLRIGVSAAKGLCFALNKPLISIDTLTAIAHQITTETGYIVPMIDARRMEVYTTVLDANYTNLAPIEAKIITKTSFKDLLEQNKVYF